jgi:hypothetical protein
MSDPETTRPPAARPGGRTRGAGRPRLGPASGAIGVAPFREAEAGGVDWQSSLGLNTSHCTIVVVDVEGFGQHSRTNPNKVRIRRGMYCAIERAFAAAEIQWAGCRQVDLGDGVLVLAPAQISKTLFADMLLEALADELVAHNSVHLPPERIRLRLVLHAGEVSYDDHGVTGSSILHAQELLDAPELKQALAETKAVLAVIASDWIFDEVIRHSEQSSAAAYRFVDTAGRRAWIRLLARRRDLGRWRRLG